MKRRTLLQSTGALALTGGPAWAEPGFPSKTLRYIVPVAAGVLIIVIVFIIYFLTRFIE
jgi:hypothetical protein